jgi:hypothetical protein
MTDLPALREAVAKMTAGAELVRYEHGGGRLAVFGPTDAERVLVADFYQEGDREGFVALRNAAPALLDEREALRVELDIEKKLHARAAEAHAALLDEREALKDDICMVVNRKPLDPDEDHDKNLLAIVALLDELEALKAKLDLWAKLLPATALAVMEAEAQRAAKEPPFDGRNVDTAGMTPSTGTTPVPITEANRGTQIV